MKNKTKYEMYLGLYRDSAVLLTKMAELQELRLNIMKKYKGFRPGTIDLEGITTPDKIFLDQIDKLMVKTNEALVQNAELTIVLIAELTNLEIHEITSLS